MTINDNRIDARDWSLLGLLSILWGGSFFFNGVVLRELPPFTLVLLRVLLAVLLIQPRGLTAVHAPGHGGGGSRDYGGTSGHAY